MSIVNQTRKVDHLIIFDDNDNPIDMRNLPHIRFVFEILTQKQISWEVIFGQKKGQHYNHELANNTKFDWVWRIDDDNIAENNVLENLCSYISDDVGAIGGSIIIPNTNFDTTRSTGKIENIDTESNIQWNLIREVKEVDHLHCSFLYRTRIANYNLGLSRVAHREETLFTYEIKKKGYRILAIPNTITWHSKNPNGGIRSEKRQELYEHDENIFRNIVQLKNKTIVVINNGMGDHIVFKRVLKDIKDPVVFSSYPQIIPGRSIEEAKCLFGDIEQFNIYKKMDEWGWKGSIENAYRKLYMVEK
jgi:hypothetical protein